MSVLRAGGLGHEIGPEARKQILAQYNREGFGYADYPNESNYGVAVSAPSWAVDQIANATSLRVVDLFERGLDDHQDVVTCVQR